MKESAVLCQCRNGRWCTNLAAYGGSCLSCGARSMWCRCQDESIDELAAYLGVGEAVAAMTAK